MTQQIKHLRIAIFSTLFFFLLKTLNSASVETEFPEILNVQGVIKAEYHEPFLLIQLRPSAPNDALKTVSEIIKTQSDPGISKITGPIFERYGDRRSFNEMLRLYERISSIDSVKDLKKLYYLASLTTIYKLDWKSDEIIASRTLYKKSTAWVSPRSLEKEKITAKRFAVQFTTVEKKPDSLLCMHTSLGVQIYPIFSDVIRVSKKEVSFSEFAAILKQKHIQYQR